MKDYIYSIYSISSITAKKIFLVSSNGRQQLKASYDVAVCHILSDMRDLEG